MYIVNQIQIKSFAKKLIDDSFLMINILAGSKDVTLFHNFANPLVKINFKN